MSDDLRDLYQESILDHNKSPRNHGSLKDPDGEAEGYNPLCGDEVKVFIKMKEDVIEDIRFEGTGCALCIASASIMTEAVCGKSIEDVEDAFTNFNKMLAGHKHNKRKLKKLVVFSGVGKFPMRVKCVTLSWHTLRAAFKEAK
jgi:nitrogen fixation NifU-like protein